VTDADREPLEAGLPDDAESVTDFTEVPTMAPVPIPDDFEPEDLVDLPDLGGPT
jgi:hypothetical protein